MTLSLQKDTKKVWTYEDYLELPDDGKRYEIIDGVLYVSPSPLTIHQRLSKRLEFFLYQLEQAGLGEVFNAPMDVLMPGCTPVQPDLIFLTSDQRGMVKKRGVHGAPHLVAEILSPSSRGLDRVKKLNKYAGAGVSNYVIVDPEVSTLEWFRLEGEGYRLAQGLSEEDQWTFLGSTLNLTEFFANLTQDDD